MYVDVNIWTSLSYCSYFAQILEEHGPLVAEDPLLVGELENFPSVAQLKIQEAGGFAPFLLESLRFIKFGRCIGLAKHAVSLQQAGHGPSLDELDDLNELDELDVIEDPDTNSVLPDYHVGHDPAFTSYLDGYSSAQTEVYPHPPYVFGSLPPLQFGQSARGVTMPGDDPFSLWTNGDCQEQATYFLPNDYGELDLYSSEVQYEVWETDPSSGGVASVTTEESFWKKDASVQVNTNITLAF